MNSAKTKKVVASLINPACGYASLANYNSSGPSVPRQLGLSGTMIVPSYQSIGYDALTAKNGQYNCNGFFNIQNAYGANSNSCNQKYLNKGCGGAQ